MENHCITFGTFIQGQEVADQIISFCPKSPHPEVVRLDLSSLQSVRDCAKELLGKLTSIDYLINNAGENTLPIPSTVCIRDVYKLNLNDNAILVSRAVLTLYLNCKCNEVQ